MDGILNINKPRDMTSFQVVAKVKWLCREKQAGHAGTLDPQATGVLPVCLGQATRIIEYLFDATKSYRAQVELGITTDTYDAAGKVIHVADAARIRREMVEGVLAQYRGTIQQVPPMYSAIKHKGKPLYKLARSGIEVERRSRSAHIYNLEISGWEPPVVTLEIVCSKGTYVRSLANDIGEALGCGAHLKSLVRPRVGPFTIEDALTLPRLEEALGQGYGEKYLYPLDFALLPFTAVVVNEEKRSSLIHGAPIDLDIEPEAGSAALSTGRRSRVYTEEGCFLGMIKYDPETGRWWPEKIFFRPSRV
jgi:tRNA pseudouridine55 synthase